MKNTNEFLEIRNIGKRYDSQTALEAVNLSIRKGEFFSLLGPSGCGKSTLLRILAGLETPTSGELLCEGVRIDGKPARERPFNMVFQKYALFPHLSVEENVAFGLRIKKLPHSEIKTRVAEALCLVGLEAFASRRPETLSGGQAQRVALARALVNRPSVLLLDEPLTALDQKLREHMQSELRLLQRRLGLTFIFVTHDQEEAMLLSDRVAVMNAGRVEQVSEPEQIYEDPASIFCARFVGRRNEIPIEIANRDGEWASLRISGGRAARGRYTATAALSGPARAFVRPERLRVITRDEGAGDELNFIEGEVMQILFRGARREVLLGIGGDLILRAYVDTNLGLRVGERAAVAFSPEETHVFHEESVSTAPVAER